MRRRTPKRRGRATALAAVLLVAGCSSGGDAPKAEGTPPAAPSGDRPIEARQLEVGDLTFDALVAGRDGDPTVFLLHGFPQTSQSWREVMPPLAEAGYRVVAPDLRGYSPGARPVDPARYEMPDLVGDVLAMADVLGADRFHVVGHDWGAMLTWNLGIGHPERVASMVTLSVPHPLAFARAMDAEPVAGDDRTQAERSAYMEVFAADDAEALFLDDDAAFLRSLLTGPGFTPAEVDAYVEHFSADGAMTGALNWYRSAQLGTEVGPAEIPTMHIWSTGDTALGRTGAVLTEDHVTGPYRFEVLDGVSHWIPDEAPDELTTLVLEHLDDHT